ncbi:MAG TPA: serine/threonine-protein kinase [Gemmataceae bacterium]|nr:serine/threonine-protein kinase [Gemmataceae bacterium]
MDTMLAFRAALAGQKLLDAKQLATVEELRANLTDVHALGKELVQRRWLTAWQAQILLRNPAAELNLGSYLLLELLGEGGMGKVYKARHQMMDRTVALKVIRPDRITSREAVRRFRREIQAAAQLSHPNIVLAYDADQIGEIHFFAMEYVDGIDLGRLVYEKGRLPVREACDYIRQAAHGLQHAHERGLIHRDIKPSNLLLTVSRQDSVRAELSGVIASRPPSTPGSGDALPGVIKILDLGLARLQETAESEAPSRLTHEGFVIGTPDFLAPEQARNSSKVDIRTDIYALGGTLYYLLTGEVPYPGGTATEKLLKHAIEPAPEVRELRPDVPEEVAALLRSLLAKDPKERFQTPADLAAALAPLCVAAGSFQVTSRRAAAAGEQATADADPSTASKFRLPSLTQARLEDARMRRTRSSMKATKTLLAVGIGLACFFLSGGLMWLVVKAMER